jgi:hypothetical protein
MDLFSRTGLRYNEKTIVPGAQTERRGGAGPVGDLLGGEAPSAAFRFIRLVEQRAFEAADV